MTEKSHKHRNRARQRRQTIACHRQHVILSPSFARLRGSGARASGARPAASFIGNAAARVARIM